MRLKVWLICICLLALVPPTIFAQTHKALTNDDVVSMTKQGFNAPLIVKAIQTKDTNFDVSAQAMVDLKNAGLSQDVMESMLSALENEPSASTAALHGTTASPAGA